MEPEPTTASAALPTVSADADADMSIDYGAGGDAAMEEDAPKEGEITVEEAEMADDEASGWEKEAAAADAMLEEDQPFQTEAVSAVPFEAPISLDDRPLPVDFAQPPSCSAPQDPPLAPAPTEIELAPAGVDEPVVSSLPFSTDEPPSAIGGVDAPLEEALAGPELSSLIPPVEVPVDEAASGVDVPASAGEEGITVEVAAEPTPSVDAASAATDAGEAVEPPAMTASEANALEYKSGAASAAAEVEAVPAAEADLVEAAAPEPSVALGSTSSDSASRPLVDKDPLLSIEVPAHPPAESSSSSRGVPAVFLSFDNTTYSLFHPHRLLADDNEDSPAAGSDQEDLPLLLSAAEQHDLYYQPVEILFRVVREHFPELKDQQDELVLEFDEIGIALGEDNVYSRQVTLFDFDRIHLGCQLPGRLHARLSSQGRFASGFNALAQHIANSYSAGGVGEEEEGDESVTVAGDEEDEGEEVEFEVLEEGEEGEEESVGERPADDHDGPDSEYVHVGEDEEEGAGGEGEAQSEEAQEQGGGDGEEEVRGEDDFDLEQALAQLDGDDVVAVVEGVQEDYLLSENSARPEEGGVVEGEVQENGEVADEVAGGEPLEEDVEEEKAEEVAAPVGGEEPAAAEPATDDVPLTTDAPQESVGETDLAQAAEEEGQPEPGAEDESPTPPLGEDALAAQAPVSDPATTEENGTDAAETVEPVVEDAGDSAFESVGATGEVLDANAETALAAEEPADSTDDVIIDYDEAFDGSTSNRADVQAQPPTAPRSAAGPTAAPITPALNGRNGENGDVEDAEEGKSGVVDEAALLSPKRSRESFLDGQEEVKAGDDATAGEAKRPRLTDPAAVSSA